MNPAAGPSPRARPRAGALAGLCAVLLLACAPAARADELKLLVWINGDKGYNGLQKVGDAFARASGVRVTVQPPEGAPDKFQSSTGAGKGPDIFCWPHDRTGEWARSGLIVPVRPSARIRGEIEDSAWKAFEYQGQTWGYPLAIEAIGLIYNKALLPTPPTRFEDIPALDRRVAARGKMAILWDYGQRFFCWALMK